MINLLVLAKSFKGARLNGLTLQMFDLAADDIGSPDDNIAAGARKLLRADLRRATLKCGASTEQTKGWRKVAAAALERQKYYLAMLRKAPGIIVDASCRGL